MPSIQVQCSSCGGTGLYSGFAEPEGTAVICHGCSGTGATTLTYKEYTGRKRTRKIQRVMGDGGMWFARTGKEKTISYQEFLDAVPEASQD